MDKINLLHNLQEIKLETPADKIIRQIRKLITTRQLNPSDCQSESYPNISVFVEAMSRCDQETGVLRF